MSNKEAINELNSCHAFGLSSECRSLAKLALEKQIPKKPVYQGEHEKCPCCGSFYIEDFCAKCGQKIKWY